MRARVVAQLFYNAQWYVVLVSFKKLGSFSSSLHFRFKCQTVAIVYGNKKLIKSYFHVTISLHCQETSGENTENYQLEIHVLM